MGEASRPPDFGGFAAPDAFARPQDLVRYLDAVRDLGPVSDWKTLSIDRLHPRPGAVLLDVGCGTGEDVVALAARAAPGGRAVGVDVSRTMVDEAGRRWAGSGAAVEFVVAGAEALPFPDAGVDGVRTERTLQHVADPAAAVAEMVRVLRPGGWLVAAEPDWGSMVVDGPDPDANRAVTAAAVGRVRTGDIGRRLRGLFVRAGLEEVTVAARTLTVPRLDLATLLLDLPAAAQAAVDQGALTAGRRDAWLAALADADAAGTFFAALTAFMATGRRPEAPAAP